MIISALFGLLIGAVDKLPKLEPFDLSLLNDYISVSLGYFVAGINAFVAILGREACFILVIYLSIVLLLNGIYLSYQMIWWFIKKIPMINVDP